MTIQASCPRCDQSYRLPEEQAGKRVRCKGCGDAFVVQGEEEVPVLEEATDEDLDRAARRSRRPEPEELPVVEDEPEEDVTPARSRRSARDEDEDDSIQEERPRRRAAVEEDEEEEEERPRRRAADEDEEEEKEEPAKKGGGGKLLLILGGVVVLLLLMCGGGVGGGVYYVYYRSNKAVNDAAARAGLSADDVKKMQEEMEKNKDKGIFDPNKDKDKGFDPNKDKSKDGATNKDKGFDPNKDKGFDPNKDKSKDGAPKEDARPKDVASALAMLKDPEPMRKKAAVQFLTTAPIDESQRDAVASALEPLQNDLGLRRDVTIALERWAPPDDLDRLTKKLESTDDKVYLPAMDKLSKMKDERAAEVLAKQLGVLGRDKHVVKYLPRMGKLCEKYVLPYYNHVFGEIHVNARKVLDQIGTGNDPRVKQCLSDLEETEKKADDETKEGLRRSKRKSAVESLAKLKRTDDEELNGKINRQLETLLSDREYGDPAFNAMQATWATKDNVKALIDLANKDRGKEDKVIQLLFTKFPEQEAVTASAVTLLGNDRHRGLAVKTLGGLGEKGEAAVLKAVTVLQMQKNIDAHTRRAVYDVLRDAGTKKSIAFLSTLATWEGRKGGDRTSAQHALTAIASINQRAALKGKDK